MSVPFGLSAAVTPERRTSGRDRQKLALPQSVQDDVRMTFAMDREGVRGDRRRKRSEDPLVALHYQLAQARQEARLEAIVVADDAGVVVAGAGSWAMCEELAAYAPLLAQGVWSEPGLGAGSRVVEMRAEVDVQPVDIEGVRVLLCARGGRARATAIGKAAEGVARILTRAA